MPKETFYHLNAEKREKIEKAIQNELGRTSFEKASVSRIIKEAHIPRGSFYQYFEDKEDAIQYIIKNYLQLEKVTIKRILIETKGNLFETAIKIFDYMTTEMMEKGKLNLYNNIIQELKKNNISLFLLLNKKEEREQIDKLIDQSILNINEKEDLIYILKILSSITRTATANVTTGKMQKEQARKELIIQIKILKRGMEK